MSTWIEADPSITAACDEESTRYAMGGVEVRNHPTEPDRVVVAATDSRCLAVAIMDGHVTAGNAAIIPKKIFPKSKAEQNKASRGSEINKSIRLSDDGKEWRAQAYERVVQVEDIGRFPRYTECMPVAQPWFLSVTLDPCILYDLATALGCNRETSRGVELLIDVGAVEGHFKRSLPDEASFRDDVKNHVVAHVSRADGSPLVLTVNDRNNSVETIDDEKTMARAQQFDWVVVDYLPADATAEEWQDEMWSKVWQRVKSECMHVRNAIPVVGYDRAGVLMPLCPERNGTTGYEAYERIRKIAVEACRKKSDPPAEDKPVEFPVSTDGPFVGPASDAQDGGDDSDDPTSVEYSEKHGNDMQLEPVPDEPAEAEEPVPFDPPQEYTGEPVNDPMAALMALAGL